MFRTHVVSVRLIKKINKSEICRIARGGWYMQDACHCQRNLIIMIDAFNSGPYVFVIDDFLLLVKCLGETHISFCY